MNCSIKYVKLYYNKRGDCCTKNTNHFISVIILWGFTVNAANNIKEGKTMKKFGSKQIIPLALAIVAFVFGFIGISQLGFWDSLTVHNLDFFHL